MTVAINTLPSTQWLHWCNQLTYVKCVTVHYPCRAFKDGVGICWTAGQQQHSGSNTCCYNCCYRLLLLSISRTVSCTPAVPIHVNSCNQCLCTYHSS